MNLNRRVPNGLPGGVRGRKFYYFLLLDLTRGSQTPIMPIRLLGIVTGGTDYEAML